MPTGNPVSIKIALSDAGWERLTPVKGYEKQQNEHEVERETICANSREWGRYGKQPLGDV